MADLLQSRLDASTNPFLQDSIPDSIGPYTILGVLGEGGLGVVYRALQTKPIRREVALKLVKRGMDTDQVVARFETERQALALPEGNHPPLPHPTARDRVVNCSKESEAVWPRSLSVSRAHPALVEPDTREVP